MISEPDKETTQPDNIQRQTTIDDDTTTKATPDQTRTSQLQYGSYTPLWIDRLTFDEKQRGMNQTSTKQNGRNLTKRTPTTTNTTGRPTTQRTYTTPRQHKTDCKRRTICIEDNGFTHKDIIEVVHHEVGRGNILGLIKSVLKKAFTDSKTHFKKHSISFLDKYFDHKDVITVITNEIGKGKILGVVKNGGEWRVSLVDDASTRKLCELGLGIRGEDVPVRLINKNIVTVSFFGVPYYIGNDELSDKLNEYGVKQVSNWTRKCYEDFPFIAELSCPLT